MTRILVPGGTGFAGRLIASLLLTHTGVSVTLASRHPERGPVAGHLSAAHPGRVSVVTADAADPASLRTAFRGHDLVVVAAPTTARTAQVARAALDEGADWLDIQLGADKLALLRTLAPEIAAAGRWCVSEAEAAGLSPAVMRDRSLPTLSPRRRYVRPSHSGSRLAR